MFISQSFVWCKIISVGCGITKTTQYPNFTAICIISAGTGVWIISKVKNLPIFWKQQIKI